MISPVTGPRRTISIDMAHHGKIAYFSAAGFPISRARASRVHDPLFLPSPCFSVSWPLPIAAWFRPLSLVMTSSHWKWPPSAGNDPFLLATPPTADALLLNRR